MDKKDLCLEIAKKYKDFQKVENAWRLEYEKALKKDKSAIRIAHSGIKEVQDSLEVIENSIGCSYKRAKELFQEDFFGIEELTETFGFRPNVEIPKIKFTKEQLKEAREHGEMLVLRISQDNEGNPMTMKRILEIMAPRMPKNEKLLNDQRSAGSSKPGNRSWMKEEPFFTQASLKTEWVLIGKEFVPNTIANNYAHQTLELYNEMKKRGLLTPEEAEENIDLENKLKELCVKMGVHWGQDIDDHRKYDENWQEVARELASLPMNRKHRRSAVGILYDWVVRYKSRKGDGGQLGGSSYDAANSVSSSGELVSLGGFYFHGASVVVGKPDYNDDRSGVVLFRSLPAGR